MLILNEVQYLQSQELLSYIIPVSDFVKTYLIRECLVALLYIYCIYSAFSFAWDSYLRFKGK